MRFTNAYSAAPVCTPTRVGFHTGRYPARLPVGLNEPIISRKDLGERIKQIGIPHDQPTISSMLKSAGYDTALVGKWHLGYLPEFSPIRSGYDEFFGIMSGGGDYFTHVDPAGDPDLFDGEVPVERVGYITDLLTDRAIEFIRKPRTKPFYLSLHYTAPHWPWEGPQDSAVSKTLKFGPDGFGKGGSLKIYAAMMKSLDDSIGKVMAALKAAKLDGNTLVIFTSDNGGERFSFNWPFSGKKFDVHEGGIRVPAVVRWPGVTTAGRTSDQSVITMDWTATMLAAAGTMPAANYPLDGENVTAVLSGKRALYDRTFFWRTFRQGGMRSGNWKYIREGKNEFLHDLSVDETEQAEFSSTKGDVLERLRNEWKKWESEMQRYPARPQPG
jgi:arylsulfatase A-like enzyme